LKAFIGFLRGYFQNSSRKSLVLTLLFAALLVFLNYTLGLEKRILLVKPWYFSWLGFFFFYGFVLFFAWAIQVYCVPEGRAGLAFRGKDRFLFIRLLLLAPLYFSAKMIHWDLSAFFPAGWRYPWDRYAQIVLQLPAKLLLLLCMLYLCQGIEQNRSAAGFYGLTTKGFKPLPYLTLLLALLPVVLVASTRPDFLHTYPKVKNIAFVGPYARELWPWRLLYEISYGLDFLSIELFFRGFLVIGLLRYAGEYAILPMAAFYCTIHFGKPLGECISSFFGGLALGVLAWRTRSILGGLMVHLGLAWMMEVGGWLGGIYF
jgi:hypothetical protein